MTERNNPVGREPFTLIVNKGEDSQEAVAWLESQGIPFSPQSVAILPNGQPELATPRLITPVGSYVGIRRIHFYTTSFYESVTNYLQNRS